MSHVAWRTPRGHPLTEVQRETGIMSAKPQSVKDEPLWSYADLAHCLLPLQAQSSKHSDKDGEIGDLLPNSVQALPYNVRGRD